MKVTIQWEAGYPVLDGGSAIFKINEKEYKMWVSSLEDVGCVFSMLNDAHIIGQRENQEKHNREIREFKEDCDQRTRNKQGRTVI